MDQKALEASLACFHIGLRSSSQFGFFIEVEMMLRFHKLENFLSLFISVYLGVILL